MMFGKFHAKKLLAASEEKRPDDQLSDAINALCAWSKLEDTEIIIRAVARSIAVQIAIRDPLRISEHRAAVDREIEHCFELRAMLADPEVMKKLAEAKRNGK